MSGGMLVMDRHFGEILRELRESKSMTVNQLAIYSGLSSGLISKLENKKRGTPKPDTIEKLAKGLKMKYDDLMILAGYSSTTQKKESEYTLSEDEFANIVREIEEEYKIDLHGNPIAHEAVRQSLDIIARTLKSKE